MKTRRCRTTECHPNATRDGGAEDLADDGEEFEQKMRTLTARLHEQFGQIARLEQGIRDNPANLGYGT